MVKEMTLRELQRAVASEKKKANTLQMKRKLALQLRQLKSSGRSDISGRIKRGFVILTKKTGGAIVRQARLIRERQIQQSKRPKKKGGLTGRDNVFGPLDF